MVRDDMIGVRGGSPGFAPEIEGAPAGVGLEMNQDSAEEKGNPENAEQGAATEKSDNGYEEDVKGYDYAMEALRKADERLPQDEDDATRKKRERRERSRRLMASVTDGLTALSNLYFTSQYAPDMYDGGSHTKGVDARIDRMRAERERNADAHLRFALQIGDLQGKRARTVRELEAQKEKMRIAREAADREAKLYPFKYKEAQGKAEEATSKAVTAKAIADMAPQKAEKEVDLLVERVNTEKTKQKSYTASAANSYASAGNHWYGTFRGKTYQKKSDYEKAVYAGAKDYYILKPDAYYDVASLAANVERMDRELNGKKYTGVNWKK